MRVFVQASAEADILGQVEWYADRAESRIARRFLLATRQAIEAVAARPLAGAPKPLSNPQLAGLRTWPVKEFEVFRVYYLVQPDLVIVVRVLHGRRDIARILGEQGIDEPHRK